MKTKNFRPLESFEERTSKGYVLENMALFRKRNELVCTKILILFSYTSYHQSQKPLVVSCCFGIHGGSSFTVEDKSSRVAIEMEANSFRTKIDDTKDYSAVIPMLKATYTKDLIYFEEGDDHA